MLLLYIQVVFIGEDGCDTGGLTREFFRLIGHAITVADLEKIGGVCKTANAK